MKNSPETKPSFSIKPGDIFALGVHRLACGDSSDSKLMARLMGDERINLVLCDPPYGVSYVESKSEFTQKLGNDTVIENDHIQTDEEYRAFTRAWLRALVPYLEPKNSAYIFNSDRMLFALREGMQDAGFKFAQLLIWVKNHSVVGRMDYLPQHEVIAYGWRGTHKFMKSKDKSVLVYPKPAKSKLHSTMKPVGLLRRLILNSSKINDIVFDSFLGSGSTLIACEDTKRRCYGVEINVTHCKTIIERFEKHTGLKAERISSYEVTT